MKIKVISFYSKVISFLLVLLGFSSCYLIDPKDEYGVPSAKFKVKGQAIDAATEEPIENVKAVLGRISERNDSKHIYYIDSVYTKKDGKFEVNISDYLDSRKFVLRVEDSETKKFETRVDTIDFKDSNFSKGEVVKDMGKIKIVQNKENNI